MSNFRPSPPGASYHLRRFKSDSGASSAPPSNPGYRDTPENMDDKSFIMQSSSVTSTPSLSRMALFCLLNLALGFGAGLLVAHFRNQTRASSSSDDDSQPETNRNEDEKSSTQNAPNKPENPNIHVAQSSTAISTAETAKASNQEDSQTDVKDESPTVDERTPLLLKETNNPDDFEDASYRGEDIGLDTKDNTNESLSLKGGSQTPPTSQLTEQETAGEQVTKKREATEDQEAAADQEATEEREATADQETVEGQETTEDQEKTEDQETAEEREATEDQETTEKREATEDQETTEEREATEDQETTEDPDVGRNQESTDDQGTIENPNATDTSNTAEDHEATVDLSTSTDEVALDESINKDRTNLHVSQLLIYPIKGCAPVAVESARLTPRGLENDRLMMVVDFTGRGLNQKKYPQLALAHITTMDNGDMRLEASNVRAAEFTPRSRGTKVMVTVCGTKCEAVDQGDAPADFFASLLEIAGVRLVRMRDGFERTAPGTPDCPTSFADAFPLLLAAEPSGREVARWVGQDISVLRFRPNIVVDGDNLQPFDEDAWVRFRAGPCEFDVTKPCTRCNVVTVDYDAGVYDDNNEPLETLRKYRTFGDSVCFGQNIVPRCESNGAKVFGTDKAFLRVGENIEVLERRENIPQPDGSTATES